MANVVNDGDIRIFPYLGDTYLGVEKTGYSNKKSAMKFMKTHSVVDPSIIYDHFGGKNTYERKYSKFKSKETTKIVSIYGNEKEEHIWEKKGTDLSDDEYNTLVHLYQGYEEEWYRNHYPNEFGEKIEELGYHPTVGYIDDGPYYYYEEKYVKEHVEYRKGIIHLNVEFTGELEK